MNKIVECVPNFSEGRDEKTIQAIADSISAVKGVRLLNVEPDKDYNRVVVTFAGEPSAAVEAALEATKTACDRIDMRNHKGEHPRMGATDVVPFVPVSNITMEECVQLANQFGAMAAEQLGIPVYLYAQAARRADRKKLPDIRAGEYEALPSKLKDAKWYPEFGPKEYTDRVAKSGATATGARFFLIAYNVNLTTSDVKLADEIAFRVRESGRPKRNDEGKVMKDENGKTIRIPGTLRETQAKGIFMDAHQITQVSMNLLNYLITGIHTAYEECKKEAQSLGFEVTGSEIVGLVPKDALVMAGKFYAEKTKQRISDDGQFIDLAIGQLGLSQLAPFIPEKKIIDLMI
ncbi:MAG: glutamate formimidoyltransferase [Bacteroidetes bacterium]|nr:glutamate formimidoyltransferase [Bacteroidota bacterium]